MDLIEMARRLYRGLEMQAAIMRDPARTGGWDGAERVAAAFERQAEAAKKLHDALVGQGPVQPAGDGSGRYC
jgi:hypothetical protein